MYHLQLIAAEALVSRILFISQHLPIHKHHIVLYLSFQLLGLGSNCKLPNRFDLRSNLLVENALDGHDFFAQVLDELVNQPRR